MRVVQPPQTQLGEPNIADIRIDIKSRDDIPQLLRGLQHLYLNVDLRQGRIYSVRDPHTARCQQDEWTTWNEPVDNFCDGCAAVRFELGL